jgi:hypothetical protein
MPVESLPWSIQGQSHAATVARNHSAAVLGAPAQAETSAVGLTAGGSHGVVNAGDLVVAQNGTPNMSVNVAAGRAFIRGTQAAGSLQQGVYSFFNDGTVNLAISAANATNPRRDLVVAQVRDANYSGSSNDARLFVVTGTPAASPVDPAVPVDCLVLARVAVAANATTITNANITDLRTFARTPVRTAWGVVGRASQTAAQTGISTVVDVTGLTVTFTAVADRVYRVEGMVRLDQVTSPGLTTLTITDGANNQLAATQRTLSVQRDTLNILFYATPAAGSVTYKLRLTTTAGTVSALGAPTSPNVLIVEDIGPA